MRCQLDYVTVFHLEYGKTLRLTKDFWNVINKESHQYVSSDLILTNPKMGAVFAYFTDKDKKTTWIEWSYL